MINADTIIALREINQSNTLDMYIGGGDGTSRYSWEALCNALDYDDDPDTQARILRRLGIADVTELRNTMADAIVAHMHGLMALVRTLRCG